MGEMEATVGLVFGLGRERIQRDLKEMGDGASMDEVSRRLAGSYLARGQ